jgi:hypothetical protein
MRCYPRQAGLAVGLDTGIVSSRRRQSCLVVALLEGSRREWSAVEVEIVGNCRIVESLMVVEIRIVDAVVVLGRIGRAGLAAG